ncbi:MAG: hypothetical protein F6K21_29670 [Symploca sp. SIO2D2]|nr:hypothetical protein [Symploca sp. SIO2D2]
MTGAITYTSEDDFEPDYKVALIEEAAQLCNERTWWNEPLNFTLNPQYPDALDGSSRLLRRYLQNEAGQQRNIDYRDDMLLAMVDYSHIIGVLAAIGRIHEIDWNICYPATPREKQIGMILGGQIENRIFEFLIHEMQALDINDAELEDQALHKAIRAKYFTETGEMIFEG